MKKVFLFLSSCLLGLAVNAAEYQVKIGTTSFALDKGNYAVNYDFSESIDISALAKGDVITFSMDGTFDQTITSVTIGTVVDNSATATPTQWWTEIGGDWTSSITVEGNVPTAAGSVTLNEAPSSGCNKLVVQLQIVGEIDGVSTINFKDANDNYEPVSYTINTITEAIMALNDAGDGYQCEIDITEQLSGKTVNKSDKLDISIKGDVDQDIASVTVVIIDGSWNQLSDWGSWSIPVNDKKIDGSVSVILTKDVPETAKIVLAVQPAIEDVETVNIAATSSEGGEEGGETTAIESVASNAFAINGGMVYSAGQITVYNIAGKVIATASKNLNVNKLSAGIYFIVAKEGTIKYVK